MCTKSMSHIIPLINSINIRKAFISLFFYPELLKGYKDSVDSPLWAQCQASVDMKFSYVVSCQKYGIHKRSGDSRAKDILRLMAKYVSNNNLPR